MKTQTISLMTLLACVAALTAAWGQVPLPPPPAKANPAAPQLPYRYRTSFVDSDNLVLSDTGKSPVDKAAIKAREEADAESNQAVSEGEACLKIGKTQEAIALYQNALAITPTDGLAYRRLAEAYTASGKLDEASQVFHKFLVEGFGAGNGNGGVVDTADEWAEYALVLLKTKQDAKALQAYNHAAFVADYEFDQHDPSKPVPHLAVLLPEVALMPTSPDQVPYTPERLQALADTALAYQEMSLGSNMKAITHMKEAAKLYPDSAAIQYYLGEVLSRSYYVYLDSAAKDKAAAWAAYQEDKKATDVAYKKAAELGDDATVAAAKERLVAPR